jgi:hypothetical protein
VAQLKARQDKVKIINAKETKNLSGIVIDAEATLTKAS